MVEKRGKKAIHNVVNREIGIISANCNRPSSLDLLIVLDVEEGTSISIVDIYREVDLLLLLLLYI